MNDGNKRSSVDIATHLSMLVLVCVLPAALSVLWLVVSEFNLGQDRLAHDARERTRTVVNSIDREFATVQAAMGGLATSKNISTGDLALFQAQASQVLRDLQDQDVLFSNIVLSDTIGQQLVNTRTAFGTALPRHGNEALVQQIVSTGLPVVSDLFTGNVSSVKVVNVGIPIRTGGKVSHVLTAAISTKAVADVVKRHKFPESWISVVIDSGGTIVARSHQSERFVGQKASSLLVEATQRASTGTQESRTLDGIPVVTSFTRSERSGWSVAVGIPKYELNQELWHSL